MTARIHIGISEYQLAEPPAVLVTYGLGSCLAIALYDPARRLGTMAHTLLPTIRVVAASTRPAKYVDAAIDLMLGELTARGSDRRRLVAKIFGGANMFEPLLGGGSENSVGTRNIRSAREALATVGIPLVAEDVGGNFGRTVEFDLTSGTILVRAVRGREGEMTF